MANEGGNSEVGSISFGIRADIQPLQQDLKAAEQAVQDASARIGAASQKMAQAAGAAAAGPQAALNQAVAGLAGLGVTSGAPESVFAANLDNLKRAEAAAAAAAADAWVEAEKAKAKAAKDAAAARLAEHRRLVAEILAMERSAAGQLQDRSGSGFGGMVTRLRQVRSGAVRVVQAFLGWSVIVGAVGAVVGSVTALHSWLGRLNERKREGVKLAQELRQEIFRTFDPAPATELEAELKRLGDEHTALVERIKKSDIPRSLRGRLYSDAHDEYHAARQRAIDRKYAEEVFKEDEKREARRRAAAEDEFERSRELAELELELAIEKRNADREAASEAAEAHQAVIDGLKEQARAVRRAQEAAAGGLGTRLRHEVEDALELSDALRRFGRGDKMAQELAKIIEQGAIQGLQRAVEQFEQDLRATLNDVFRSVSLQQTSQFGAQNVVSTLNTINNKLDGIRMAIPRN